MKNTLYVVTATLTLGTITGQVNAMSYPDPTASGPRFYKVKVIAP